MGFLFWGLMPVDFRAQDLMLGRPAPTSPVSSRPGSAAVPPGALPWPTPGVCAGASGFVSGFPTLRFAKKLISVTSFRRGFILLVTRREKTLNLLSQRF